MKICQCTNCPNDVSPCFDHPLNIIAMLADADPEELRKIRPDLEGWTKIAAIVEQVAPWLSGKLPASMQIDEDYEIPMSGRGLACVYDERYGTHLCPHGRTNTAKRVFILAFEDGYIYDPYYKSPIPLDVYVAAADMPWKVIQLELAPTIQ